LDVDAGDFDERSWAGQTLAVGDEVRIEVSEPTDTLHHDHAGTGISAARSDRYGRRGRRR
jgi:hypothetical protein